MRLIVSSDINANGSELRNYLLRMQSIRVCKRALVAHFAVQAKLVARAVTSRANGRHWPHFGLHPSCANAVTGQVLRAMRAASRTWFSRRALQTQTITIGLAAGVAKRYHRFARLLQVARSRF